MANETLNEKLLMAIVTGQIRVPINPFLGLLPKRLWNKKKDVFYYGTEFLPIAASATATNDITIGDDSDFLITHGIAVVTDTADASIASTANAFAPFNPPFLVTLTDSGSGRSFMNIALAFANLFGTAQLPAIWPFPKLLRAASTVSVRLQNLVATDRRVRLALGGFKIFKFKDEG